MNLTFHSCESYTPLLMTLYRRCSKILRHCGIVGNDSIYGAVIILLNSPTKFMNAPYIIAPRFSAVFACLGFPRADGRQLMQQRRFLAQHFNELKGGNKRC